MTGDLGFGPAKAEAEREAGPIGAEEIRRTYQRIRPYLRRTPTLTVPLAALTGAGHDDSGLSVVLKLEQMQCGARSRPVAPSRTF